MTGLPQYCMPLLSVPDSKEHDEIVSELSLEGIKVWIEWRVDDIVRLWVQHYISCNILEGLTLIMNSCI